MIWPETGLPSGKEPACQCRRYKRHRFNLRVGKIPWRRAWQPTPVSLPGEFHGQRSLASCSLMVAQSWTQLNWLSTHAHDQKQLDQTNTAQGSAAVLNSGPLPKVTNLNPGHFVCVKFVQSCPTLCDPMDYSLPGSSVHRIIQARILEWVVIPFSTGSFQPRDWAQVFCTAGRFFTVWTIREALAAAKLSFCVILVGSQKEFRTIRWTNIL